MILNNYLNSKLSFYPSDVLYSILLYPILPREILLDTFLTSHLLLT